MHNKFLINVLIKSVLIPLIVLCDDKKQTTDQLLSLVVIFRHGDRTPVRPYPTDPYRNTSYWPVGFGQLTNTGKLQEFQLGQWLRERYNSFLPANYSEKDIYVQSSDVDRTLMSAEANLAGLYPPQNQQIWNPNLKWQPIPIHTKPELDDELLAMKRNCPKYNQLLKELFKTKFFVDIAHKNHDLYAYLTRYSGDKITNLEKLEYLYNTLLIESLNNLTLPEWAQKVYPTKLLPSAQLSFATACYTQQLARLKAGPLLQQIVDYFRSLIFQNYKLLVYSGHDTTIANVLNSLGVFEYHCPPYASTVIFELWSNKETGQKYVKTFYKNSTKPLNLLVKGCDDFNCKFDKFFEILQPILINSKQWEMECKLNLFVRLFDNILFVILFSMCICLVLIIIGIVIAIRSVKIKNQNVMYYTQLPVEDVA